MTDVEWAVVRPLVPVPGWMRGRGGQPEVYCHRAILDAVRYLVDNGIKWRAMPVDFPPWDRVYAFFRRRRDRALARECCSGKPAAALLPAGSAAAWPFLHHGPTAPPRLRPEPVNLAYWAAGPFCRPMQLSRRQLCAVAALRLHRWLG
ncbi:transposase [Streptomyces sp. NPDC048417]|uniref:transposase n=1 Tax=Streptomyces sp. NPDC048417 TaxID=3155387 RepID=UPI00342A810E